MLRVEVCEKASEAERPKGHHFGRVAQKARLLHDHSMEWLIVPNTYSNCSLEFGRKKAGMRITPAAN